MRGPWTLTAKLYTSGISFLVLALLSIGATLWIAWSLEGGAAAVNEAGRMRMQTYRLALEMSAGADPAASLALMNSFEESLALLRSGDPSRPLFVPWSAASRERFAQVNERWGELRGRWLAARPTTATASRDARDFVALVDGLVASIESQMARLTTILQMVQLAMMALAIGGAVVMLYTGYLFVLNPLARL
jgi:two-component system, NarL family, nitrate/nitrite sensor histidine kinase NarX